MHISIPPMRTNFMPSEFTRLNRPASGLTTGAGGGAGSFGVSVFFCGVAFFDAAEVPDFFTEADFFTGVAAADFFTDAAFTASCFFFETAVLAGLVAPAAPH